MCDSQHGRPSPRKSPDHLLSRHSLFPARPRRAPRSLPLACPRSGRCSVRSQCRIAPRCKHPEAFRRVCSPRYCEDEHRPLLGSTRLRREPPSAMDCLGRARGFERKCARSTKRSVGAAEVETDSKKEIETRTKSDCLFVPAGTTTRRQRQHSRWRRRSASRAPTLPVGLPRAKAREMTRTTSWRLQQPYRAPLQPSWHHCRWLVPLWRRHAQGRGRCRSDLAESARQKRPPTEPLAEVARRPWPCVLRFFPRQQPRSVRSQWLN